MGSLSFLTFSTLEKLKLLRVPSYTEAASFVGKVDARSIAPASADSAPKQEDMDGSTHGGQPYVVPSSSIASTSS